jgi:M6 family metalloprotease-like protein
MYGRKTLTVFLVGAAVSLLRPAPVRAQDRISVNRIHELNNDVLRLDSALREAIPARSAELRNQALAALATRAAALTALMDSDPHEVLASVFSPELLAHLATRFPEAASNLEIQGTWSGPAETWVYDYPDGSHRSVTQVKTGSETLEVHMVNSEPVPCSQNSTLEISGVRLGNKVAAESSKIQPQVATPTANATPAACSTTGPQNTAVLMVTFPGVTPPSYVTAQSVSNAFFGGAGFNLAGYWQEASYGKTSVVGNVFGWYTLSTSYSCATTDQMRAEAISLASKSGVNFQNYTRIFLVVPDMGCGWAGAANMACQSLTAPTGLFNASTSYINWVEWGTVTGNDTAAVVIMHEGGHNLGLNHARSRAFGSDAVGPLGTQGALTEYGDSFSAMSNGGSGHYAAPQKAEILNWLSSSNFKVVQNPGSWTLAPLETAYSGLQALKIQRGTGNNAWLWLEYRQPLGPYDSAYNDGNTWSSNVFSGATIHYEDAYTTNQYSDLLDFSPGDTYAFWTPDLLAGQTWTDPYSNLSITVNSATASGLQVTVNYGAATCTHANPTVVMSPANPTTAAGSSVSYTISVTNNDSSACPAGAFNVSATQPTGWTGNLSSASLPVSPGQTLTATLTETVPTTTAAATYSVSATAANGTYSGSASANCSVTSSSGTTTTLTNSLTVGGSTFTARQTVSATSMVLSGGAPSSGASVTFTLTKSNGAKVTGTSATASNGTAPWSYKLGPKDPSGSYTMSSVATSQSQSAASNTVSFTVQ